METLLKRFFLILAVTFTSMAFTSCGGDDDDDEPIQPSAGSILGPWSQTNDHGTLITLTFSNNNTGSINYKFPTGSTSTEFFEYSFTVDRDGYMSLFVTSDDCQLRGEYEVKITPSTLTIKGSISGKYGTYQFKRQ